MPHERVILPLLKAVCGEGVRTTTSKGRRAFGCGDGDMDEILQSRDRPRRYPWMPYVLWQADGVIFGHFLSPTSEDVAISCFGCSGHPSLFGGSLLLTKKLGNWEPVGARQASSLATVGECRCLLVARSSSAKKRMAAWATASMGSMWWTLPNQSLRGGAQSLWRTVTAVS